jgi:UDP-N-acetylmuramate dehydrogenase
MSLQKITDVLCAMPTAGVFRDTSLAPFTTFCIGGDAELLVIPKDIPTIIQVMEACHEHKTPMHILGAGSNIVVPDQGVKGVVLCLANGMNEISLDDDNLLVQAGVGDEHLALFAYSAGISGFEWIYDIPGSVGGAIYMNAGNNDGEIANNVVSVTWLDPQGRLHITFQDGLDFGYRHSLFHDQGGLILQARLSGNKQKARSEIMAEMLSIRNKRRTRFPEETMCAGSIFKRPSGDYAGRLIEVSGCGGLTVGGAMVSPKHKGFIVNIGNASAADVFGLVAQVKERVLEQEGIVLETEVRLFGENPFINP